MKNEPYTLQEMVAVLLVKTDERGRKYLLCGQKRDDRPHDPCAGFVVPAGGKIDMEEDTGKIGAALRETKTEAGYEMKNATVVGLLDVRFRNARKRNLVHIILCTEWTGRLRLCKREFVWMKFIPFDRLPWQEMPPEDEKLLREILIGRKKRRAIKLVGRDLRDPLAPIRTRPLY